MSENENEIEIMIPKCDCSTCWFYDDLNPFGWCGIFKCKITNENHKCLQCKSKESVKIIIKYEE